MKDSTNGDGSLYIADGTRGENIPKSWVDAIFQHKLSEIGLYWVEKEKTFVVTESLVQLDGERLHQEITAPICVGAAWTCLDFSNISESEAVKIYYDTLPREPKYGETWRILISPESSWVEAKVAEIGELTVFVYTDPRTGLPAVCNTDSVHSTNRFKATEIKSSVTLQTVHNTSDNSADDRTNPEGYTPHPEGWYTFGFHAYLNPVMELEFLGLG